jgi:uncharacterized protein (TIGR03067 family)
MFAKPLWLVPLACVLLTQPAGDDRAKKDLERMQGEWVLHAMEVNGKDVVAPKLADTFLIVKGDEYRTKVKDKLQAGVQLKLDPSKNPNAVDMIRTEADGSETVLKGIYVLDKDTLKICRGLVAGQERPNQFATWPDTNYFVVTWKKK